MLERPETRRSFNRPVKGGILKKYNPWQGGIMVGRSTTKEVRKRLFTLSLESVIRVVSSLLNSSLYVMV